MSASLGVRLAVAVVLAAGLVAGLAWLLREPPAETVEAVERPPWFGLPADIPRGRTLMVYLATADRELPPRVAPVARIDAAGRVVLERPAPIPDGPVAGAWLAAGIVVPEADLRKLTPVARAALLEVWRAWSGEGDVSLADVAVTLGVEADRESLRRLSRFVR